MVYLKRLTVRLGFKFYYFHLPPWLGDILVANFENEGGLDVEHNIDQALLRGTSGLE
jgi:hypothetical protein